MVAAGWTYDPSPEYDDGVTCMYCNLSLDGWEPKDDPYVEHQKRCPDCPFFSLAGEWAEARKQAKGRKGKGRASRGSKASRSSTQSVASIASEAPSQLSLVDIDEPVGEDDSVLTTATNATTASANSKGRKKATAKGSKKGTRGKKAATAVAADNSMMEIDQPTQIEEPSVIDASAKPVRKATRGKKAAVVEDNSAMEVERPTQIDYPSIVEEPPKRQIRRKASRTEQPTPIEETLNASQNKRPTRGKAAKAKQQARLSDDESQLHSELQAAVDASIMSTQQATRPTRGTKRTSDGAPKMDSSVLALNEEPIELKSQQAKSKRGRKPKAAANTVESQEDPQPRSSDASEVPQRVSSVPRVLPKSRKGRKAAKTAEPVPEPQPELEPGVAQDAEVEEAPTAPTDSLEALEAEKDEEFDFAASLANPINPYAPITGTPDHGPGEVSPAPSTPTPARTRRNHTSNRPLPMPPSSSARKPELQRTTTPASSPNSSDAENKPPSSRPASARPPLSVQRIPLAAGTPNRQFQFSPSKRTIGGLRSALPWSPTDLENIFLNSPVKRNHGLDASFSAGKENALHMQGTDIEHLDSKALKEVVKKVKEALKPEEKKMTVEQWVRWNAQVGEERLRQECEGLVMVFETEGGRALRSLEGIECLP
jgi:hypothetical protein